MTLDQRAELLLTHANPDALASSGEIARMLMTTSRQVHAWHSRRRTTRFPEPVGSVLVPRRGGPRRGPLFRVADVLEWWVGYDPNANRGNHWAAKRAAAQG